MEGSNQRNLTNSQWFIEVLLFLSGPELLKLQLVSRDFYENIVPQFMDKDECPLTTHVGLDTLILKEIDTIKSLKTHLGHQKIKANLWRGTRDGFRAHNFHRLCDGQGKTLTVVKTTRGTIFGGFTDISWAIPSNICKSKSFYITENKSGS